MSTYHGRDSGPADHPSYRSLHSCLGSSLSSPGHPRVDDRQGKSFWLPVEIAVATKS